MLPWPTKETTEIKELKVKDEKKKMRHPNQEEWRKDERQIMKDKQQVKKEEKMFDTRPQNEEGKLERENRGESM